MKQRVSLARALAPNPRVLLMDEPFAALDALTREQLYGDIQEIWKARRKTIVFVTHNVREAACLGDRVLLFSPHPGRIQEEFTVDLPRPRDINSVDLAAHATRITKALKSRRSSRKLLLQNETISSGGCIFRCSRFALGSSVSRKNLVARIAAVPGSGRNLSGRRCCRRNPRKATVITMRRLLVGYLIGFVVGLPSGTPDRALETVWQIRSEPLPLVYKHYPVSAGCRWRSCGLARQKRPCFLLW